MSDCTCTCLRATARSASLAFSAIKNNDRVGLILFTDRVEKLIPPKKGKGHVMRVITEILNAR
ncbi:MAG: VWA domain-containing protein, partial [Blastochloris sp.]|nr:VWA domain-containing protein [Blastochloris sp.]